MPTTLRRLRPLWTALPILLLLSCDPAEPQGIAVPAYFPPGPEWGRLADAAPTAGIAVVNPASGPGQRREGDYAEAVSRARREGLSVLGYVATGYGARDPAEVRSEVDAYYSWYGVDGIFFDEASTDCSVASYYEGLAEHARSGAEGALSVLNPGTRTEECYMTSADVVVVFEGPYETYVSGPPAPAWTADYAPERFWHLVHSAPDEEAMSRAVRLAGKRGAGYVYVTPDAPLNPWDELSPERYWERQVEAVSERG